MGTLTPSPRPRRLNRRLAAVGWVSFAQTAGTADVKIDWEGLTKRARQILGSGEIDRGADGRPSRGSVIAFVAAAMPSEDAEAMPTIIRYTVNLADGIRHPASPPHRLSAPTETGQRPGRGGNGRLPRRRNGLLQGTAKRPLAPLEPAAFTSHPSAATAWMDTTPDASALAGRRGGGRRQDRSGPRDVRRLL